MSENNYFYDRLRSSSGIRIFVLFGSFFFLLILSSVIANLISGLEGISLRTSTLLSSAVQAILAFILPAYLLARFVSSRPLDWLDLNKPMRLMPFIGVIVVYILALPAMEFLIEWNKNLQLPESMSGLEEKFRSLEDASLEITNRILSVHSFGGIISGVLIVGILTGLAEEMFFRGSLQKIFIESKINYHLAIWFAALIFSAFHFQFFGFVPRLLMGAFFGYLLLWTKNLWVPVFAHSLNNSIVVVSYGLTSEFDNNTLEISLLNSEAVVIASVISTAIFLWLFGRYFFKGRFHTVEIYGS